MAECSNTVKPDICGEQMAVTIPDCSGNTTIIPHSDDFRFENHTECD